MKAYRFIYKEINSEDLGVVLSATPPVIKPKMRYDTITTDYTNITQFDELGYSTYNKELNFYLKDKSKITDVAEWLSGKGDLIMFNEPDKKYEAYFYEEMQIKRDSPRFYSGTATAIVQPYKHSLKDNAELFKLEGRDITVDNKGNVDAIPNMMITGTGEVSIKVNDSIVCALSFGETERVLELDSLKQDCFYNGALANRSMNGDFPKLKPGLNVIGTIGNATKLEIKKGERWI